MIFYFLLWAVWGVVCGAILVPYSKALAGFLLGVVLGPIGVIIAWLWSRDLKARGLPAAS